MPKYFSLGTEIRLCTWDPNQPPSSNTESSLSNRSLTQTGGGRTLPSNGFDVNNTRNTPVDHSEGYQVKQLSESYFEEQHGVDFLGNDKPFFLINSGEELFSTMSDGEEEPTKTDNEARSSRIPDSSQVSNITDLSTISLDAAEDPDSSLSSIDPAQFEPGEDVPEPMVGLTRRSSTKITKDATQPVPKPPSSTPSNVKPIKITIMSSKKTFAPSINTNVPQDICVNIYFNGELSTSKVICYNTTKKITIQEHNYYGRRVAHLLEVPWALVLPSHAAKEAKGKNGQLTGEQRWNKINQILHEEADEWGYQGRWRDHVGDYLIELSGMAVPKILKIAKDSRFGIIDVVITLGTSVAVNKISLALQEPVRKLYHGLIGRERNLIVVPEEKRPGKKVKRVSASLCRAGGRLLLIMKNATAPPPNAGPTRREEAQAKGRWKPTSICLGSTLRYPGAGDCWPGITYDDERELAVRPTMREQEKVFRSNGVLMGVRFVVGS